ncbi:ABC transporter substrate-binding protein [Nocardioides dongkuii]|uniref:ABC transporter substrate-binding protein n=1 Tax=Nocardioides dongkuii TaxID=2760089 RepID=UPI001877B48B|nr:ABC transporter substrate-binding protein [Nocardioides dongkuii]
MRSTVSRRARYTGLVLVGALALAGCSDSSDSEEESSDGGGGGDLSVTDIYSQGWVGEQTDEEPTQGGTLTMADYAETRSLNPTESYANGAASGNPLGAVYDVLTRYDFDTDTWVPQLAESIESNDDNTVWTLKLRPDVTFSDGTPVNADAVIGSMGYYMENYGFQALTLLANQTAMKKVDDQTVEFTVAAPWATFPAMLAGGPGMIMAPAAYDDPEKFEPIGAGAFELGNYAPAEQLVLTAREDYWGGAPNLEELRFVWLGGDDAKLESMDAGEVDAAFVRNPQAVETARRDGYDGYMYVVGAGAQFTLNAREGRPGEDVRVRKAIAHAFDNESYLERSLGGAGIPSKSIFAESSPWSTGVETPAYDQDEARTLLEEAKADGYDGKLTYVAAADPTAQQAAVQVEAQLEAVGFDVTIDAIDNIADMTSRVYVDHDFDIAQGATSIGNEDPYGALSEWLYSQSPTNGAGYASEEMDGLLRDLQAVADDPEAGMDAMRALEEKVHEDVPAVIINPAGNFVPMQDDVHGVIPTTQTIMLFHDAWKSE